MSVDTLLPQIAEVLRNARAIAVLTGAGLSAESGIPTFRDAQTGLWAQYRAEDLATPEAFERNPQLVWDWYEMRREGVRAAQPNPGHFALAAMQVQAPACTLITQNVDGLLQRAGGRMVLELHGNILRNTCFDDGCVVEAVLEGQRPPRCPQCGGMVRPDVVWFGEELPADVLTHAIRAAKECDVFLSIGTSALVHPAAQLPMSALDNGATLIEVNRDPTPLSPSAHYSVRALAGEFLPRLVKAAWPEAA
ncbi:MAG TPA: NAD-dependent deacylase [Burkholderiales bacterium]|nr:NAD-dependent deacylase [Burkholderiales bacterium]